MAKILYLDGDIKDLSDISLESLQNAVGGYIELIKTQHNERLVVNEDGISMGLMANIRASILSGRILYGNVVLLDRKDKI